MLMDTGVEKKMLQAYQSCYFAERWELDGSVAKPPSDIEWKKHLPQSFLRQEARGVILFISQPLYILHGDSL